MDEESTETDERVGEWIDEVRAGYDDLADAYDAQRAPGEEATLVREFAAAVRTDGLVVDAGCGGGRAGLETVAAEHPAVGVDISARQLALARDRVPEAALLQGDLTRLPIADDATAGLCSLHAIIHVPRERHDAVFAEFARVLEPGGELLVTTGVGPWEGRNEAWLGEEGDDAGTDDGDPRADDTRGAPMRWSFHGAERSRELLRDAGFVVTDETVIGDQLGGGEWLFVRAHLAD